MASTQTEPPPPLPTGKNRIRSRVFIAAFVALQFVVPLTYLVRDDSTDDRFTWRSLSAAEAPECTAEATAERTDGELVTIELASALHQDWVDYVRLGRRAVVDAFLDRQCADDEVASVELVTRCPDQAQQVFGIDCRTHETRPRTAAR